MGLAKLKKVKTICFHNLHLTFRKIHTKILEIKHQYYIKERYHQNYLQRKQDLIMIKCFNKSKVIDDYEVIKNDNRKSTKA